MEAFDSYQLVLFADHNKWFFWSMKCTYVPSGIKFQIPLKTNGLTFIEFMKKRKGSSLFLSKASLSINGVAKETCVWTSLLKVHFCQKSMQTFFLASSSAGLLLLRTYVHQQGCKSKEREELSNLRKNCETLLVIAKKLLLKQAQFFVQEK